MMSLILYNKAEGRERRTKGRMEGREKERK